MFLEPFNAQQITDAVAAAKEIGAPCFYFDVPRFQRRISQLRDALPEGVNVCFSVKSNPFLARYGADCADRVEVCSLGEWMLCTEQGIPADRISVGGVYQSEADLLRLAQEAPARISVESQEQLRLLSQAAETARRPLKVLLRLTSGNQFGMELDEILETIRHPRSYLSFCGLHYYSGTQKKRAEKVRRDVQTIREALLRCGFAHPELAYGPGLGVHLFDGPEDAGFSEAYHAMLTEVRSLSDMCAVTMEFGRLLAADVGLYITRIVDKKVNRGQTFYIVDGGFHHLSYYGQMGGRPSPVIYQERGADTPREPVTVCGSLCSASDILANNVKLMPAEIGDYLAFGNAGAYCVTEACSLFLSHNLPAVVLFDGRQTVIARQPCPTYPSNRAAAHAEERI